MAEVVIQAAAYRATSPQNGSGELEASYITSRCALASSSAT